MRAPRRMEAVQSPVIPVIGRLIDETPGTISLGQGMVRYPPPRAALEVLASFGRDPADHRYGSVEGQAELVDAIAAKLAVENGIATAAGGRIVVTAGGNMAFVNAVLAITDPGDEVVLLTPYYFNHEMAVSMAGCRPVAVPTDAAYQLRVDAIAAALTPRTRAVVTISPNNPTGAVYPETVLRAVSDLCRDQGIYHVHDEAYEYFTYDGARHFSPASVDGAADHTISLFSLSKAYGFASWRIGYMVIPERLFEAVIKIQDTNLICPPGVSQRAALAALRVGVDYCRPRVAELGAVRRLVLERLRDVADICETPSAQGALYCLLRVRTPLSSLALAERLIREHLVAVIPGSAFGLEGGCYLRISYGALDAASVATAMDRLVAGLRKIVR